MTRRNRGHARGFTLIELMLVVGILLVLSTVGVIAYRNIKRGMDIDTAELLANRTAAAVDTYQMRMSKYPDDQEGLQALLEVPDDPDEAETWKKYGPFIEGGKIPKDAWGTELKYMKVDSDDPSQPQFRIYSFGPNRTDDNGGDDDIPKWAER